MSLSTSKHYLHIVYVYPRLHLCSFAPPLPELLTEREKKQQQQHKFEAILPCRSSSPYPYAIAKAHLPRQMAYLCLFIYIYIYSMYMYIIQTFRYENATVHRHIHPAQKTNATPFSRDAVSPPPYAIWCGYLLMIHERTMETVRVVCIHYYIRYIYVVAAFFSYLLLDRKLSLGDD